MLGHFARAVLAHLERAVRARPVPRIFLGRPSFELLKQGFEPMSTT
jgi:hypothetical protein